VSKIRDPGGFPELLRRRAPDVDQVVVAGGDGTLNAVVQGLAETGTPLGIIPVRAVQIVVGNGRYYGSALPVAEDGEIDGELGPNTPATVIVVPRALAVLCP
jgi:diacylglycerol kinase family enzyme